MVYTRYFEAGGITIRFDSELPIKEDTFAPKFKLFEVEEPGADTVHLVHRFALPKTDGNFGKQVYKKSPWVIYRDGDRWVYILEASPDPRDAIIRQISFANFNHSFMEIFNGDLGRSVYERGRLGALTMAPTDQILLARLLADRTGCYMHSDGVNMDGRGYLFVGHSGAGKSTIATILKDWCEILCDDRMIVRKWEDGYFIHGNWSHGTLPIVSPNSAPLEGIFFLEQSNENEIVPMEKRMDSIARLLGCLVKPMVTKDWWENMIALMEDMASSVPCYLLRFDKTGRIYDKLKTL